MHVVEAAMKKRFPRFSLRALIIAVVAIGVCWTLTATWGVENVFSFYSKTIGFTERSGNTLRIANTDANEDLTPDKFWEIRATAIAPFFIRLSITQAGVVKAEPVTHFWFFGYQRQVTSRYEPCFKK
jgi:hypothetical protein